MGTLELNTLSISPFTIVASLESPGVPRVFLELREPPPLCFTTWEEMAFEFMFLSPPPIQKE